MSWLTLVGMGLAGILIIVYWQKKDVNRVLIGGKRLYIQSLIGLFYGTFSSLLAVTLINGRGFKSVRQFFNNLMQQINPSFPSILFYSICAGVGEEILFRAGIQPMIGIWPAAIVFVLLHGYINPYNLNLTIYGLFLVIIAAGFGYLFKFFGLMSAVVAHIIYDISMFSLLKYAARPRVPS